MASRSPRSRRVIGRDEPARLLSMGEAADLVGAAHMELRRAFLSGDLKTLSGRRSGRVLRLVRLSDLAHLYPVAWDVELAPEVEETVPIQEPPAAPRRRTPSVAAPALPPAAVAPVTPRPRTGHSAGSGDSVGYLWSQLDNLRDQVRRTKEQNRKLFGELSASGREVRTLLEKVSDDDTTRRGMEERLAREHAEVDAALAALRVARRMAWSAVGVLLVTVGSVLIWVGGGDEPVRAETRDDAPELVAADASDPPGFAPDPAPQPPPAETSEPITVVEPEPAPPVRAPPPDVRSDAPLVAPTRADDRPCAFHDETRPGSELRGVLGPCQGRYQPDLDAVVGRHRLAGDAYCRHHDFFVRSLGGSIARAQEVAAFSRSEGMLPPLVKMRVDRPAAGFLRERIPAWLESGFEDGVQDEHVVRALEAEDAWRIESWVRYLDFGGVEHRRTFRMDLRIGDGVEGDLLDDFAWTGDAPEAGDDD